MPFALIASDSEKAEQLVRRLTQGRYTIAEAARFLCNDYEGVDYHFLISDLKELVGKGQIPAYKPSITVTAYIPADVHNDYEEIYWNDLNDKWLPRFNWAKRYYPSPLAQLRPNESCWSCQHLSLGDAICLTANIAPDWAAYAKDIGIVNASKISCGYSPRLTSALYWAQNTNCSWRHNNPAQFKATDQVKLAEFARWVIEENSDWVIPDEFRALAKLTDVNQVDSLIELSSAAWKGRAKALAEQQLNQNPRLTIDEVSSLIHAKFFDEKIRSSYGGGKEIKVATIKDSLSKDMWFSKFVGNLRK